MKIKIEYELGNIKTSDIIVTNKINDIIDYIMNIKNNREKLLKEKLTFNIINIQIISMNDE